MMKRFTKWFFPVLFGLIGFSLYGQEANYDENRVPAYQLPALLTSASGEIIQTSQDWESVRRPELLALFSELMFGKLPTNEVQVSSRLLEHDPNVLEGKATRKQIEVTFERNGQQRKSLLLLYLPNQAEKAVPVFLAPNFQGNQTGSSDSAILYSPFSDRGRASAQSRWPIQTIIDAGYGLATVHYYDFTPDDSLRLQEGILPLLYDCDVTQLPANGGQAIAAWAWGLSRMMDCLQSENRVDASRVLLMGHSRLGKTALWAGAQDPRFALVISNNSGCGGAALSKREFGETLAIVNRNFPHWFCRSFHLYSGKESELPFDQHQLLALIAPRPLYVASAVDDQWADPRGEYLAAYEAGAVYSLYDQKGIPQKEMPVWNKPIRERIGYHIRTGKHDVTDFDWDNYIIFAEIGRAHV